MRLRFLALLIAALAFATAPVLASNVNFGFGTCSTITSSFSGSCPGNLKTDTATYKVTVGLNTYSITATGYSSATHTDHLYVKNGGPSETGLGLNGTSDDEINHGQYIYLDFSNLASQGITSGTLGFGSVQSGEEEEVCTATAVGTPGATGCLTGGDLGGDLGSLAVTWTSADPYLDITVPSTTTGNVLVLSDLSVTPTSTTPEPASVALFGTGLLALGFFVKRFRKTAEAS